MAATVGANTAPNTAMAMSAASTTGIVGAFTMATAAAASKATPPINSARLWRVASMKTPIGACNEIPISPLMVSTRPIEAWSQCACPSRKIPT